MDHITYLTESQIKAYIGCLEGNSSARLLDEIMGVNGVWILYNSLYEGTQTCQRDLYVWYMLHFASTRKK